MSPRVKPLSCECVTYPGSGKQQVSAKQSLSQEHIRAAILASWDVPRHRIAGYINLEEL
jgi:hypothetical protein